MIRCLQGDKIDACLISHFNWWPMFEKAATLAFLWLQNLRGVGGCSFPLRLRPLLRLQHRWQWQSQTQDQVRFSCLRSRGPTFEIIGRTRDITSFYFSLENFGWYSDICPFIPLNSIFFLNGRRYFGWTAWWLPDLDRTRLAWILHRDCLFLTLEHWQ